MGAFERGLCWTLYKFMESDFIHFMDYVPYTNQNKTVYSPRLLAMLLQICGYTDTVFKEMAKYNPIRKIPQCQEINNLQKKEYYGYNITLANEAFEPIYKLSQNNGARLIAKLDWVGGKELHPFLNFAQNKSPSWWHDYNGLKHNWASTMRRANIENVLNALAAAFLLNAVHYPSIVHLWKVGSLKTVIKSGDGLSEHHMPEHLVKKILEKSISQLKPFDYEHIVETDLFLYVKT